MVDKRYIYQVLPFALFVVVFLATSIPIFLAKVPSARDTNSVGYTTLCSDTAFVDAHGSNNPSRHLNLTMIMAQVDPNNMMVTTTSYVQDLSAALVNETSGQLTISVRVHIDNTLLSITNKSPTTGALTTATSFLMDGTVAWYPFDTYQAEIDLRANTGDSPFGGVENAEIGLNVDVYQHEDFDWNYYDARIERTKDTKIVALKFAVRRDFNVYTALVFVGIWAVTFAVAYIGSMAVIWKRRAPDNPVIFISALFAVPAFRNTCPGSPPYGVLFDVICTYFAIGVVCTFLVLVSIAYMRKPKPVAH
ncbi:Aste57867_14615 [Aphanomyces stellatus]|uniref:Aste57867_14615 protein n=1 Tax=Aphanomyces stellatus TaxID=120398 RepID=A0A485L250_9STRA|nr:hypothetical protein As57867_014561 [Aphanomyces stellatus]VFT91434.1 Aste57867_14615 [Aphanomyces stellatus]